MRQLLNTLFVTSEDIYLSLDGENVVASREHQEAARYPLHTLSGIVSFSYPGASPALMGAAPSAVSLWSSARRAGGFWPGSPGVPRETSCSGVPSTARRTSSPPVAALPAV